MSSASLKAIRKRIASVKNTQKITRAMKAVAMARLRRAQQDILALRPYALKTLQVLSAVAARTESEGDEAPHPLLERRPPRRVMLLVVTGDRGLCGAFNANIQKAALAEWKRREQQGQQVELLCVGRKGRDFFQRRGARIVQSVVGLPQRIPPEKAAEIGKIVVAEYTRRELDACFMAYNEFKSAMVQRVAVEPLLPITPMELPPTWSRVDFLYEPNRRALLDTLLPMYVDVEIYRALLESNAAEQGARMTAMDAATKNAGELLRKLTLQYNRARQAAITKELMEIIGGAEALKG